MRVSTMIGDEGFVGNDGVRGIEIYLDGVRVERDCVTADDDLGTVVVCSRDDAGNVVCDGDEILLETKFGKVDIVLPAGWVRG